MTRARMFEVGARARDFILFYLCFVSSTGLIFRCALRLFQCFISACPRKGRAPLNRKGSENKLMWYNFFKAIFVPRESIQNSWSVQPTSSLP